MSWAARSVRGFLMALRCAMKSSATSGLRTVSRIPRDLDTSARLRALVKTSVLTLSGSGFWLASATHCARIAPASIGPCFSSVFTSCAPHLACAAYPAFCERFARSIRAFCARPLVNIPSRSVTFPASIRASRMRTNAAFGAPQRRARRVSSRTTGPSLSNIRQSRVM
jgi:hypothetical protein